MKYIKLFENYFWTEPSFWNDKTEYDRLKQSMDYVLPKVKSGSDFKIIDIHKGTDESNYSKQGKDPSYVLFSLGGNEYRLESHTGATTYEFVISIQKKTNDKLLKVFDDQYIGTPEDFLKKINSF